MILYVCACGSWMNTDVLRFHCGVVLIRAPSIENILKIILMAVIFRLQEDIMKDALETRLQ